MTGSSSQSGDSSGATRRPTKLMEAVASRRRRVVLSVLRDRPSGLPERELATLVASAGSIELPEGRPSDRIGTVHVDLRHCHVPKLRAVSLVERDGEQVRPADTEALEEGLVASALDADLNPARKDTLFDVLSADRRLLTLRTLRTQGTLSTDDLAATVATRAGEGTAPRTVKLSLVHKHLPKLEAANVVAHDQAQERVTYAGGQDVERWLDRLPTLDP